MLNIRLLKNIVHYFLAKFNLRIISLDAFNQLQENSRYKAPYKRYKNIFDLISVVNKDSLSKLLKDIDSSKSQIAQDLFVLSELNFKRGGFFVEFGATNGIDLSNTFLLENKYDWTGILSEPSKGWHNELSKNRQVYIDKNCVWSSSNDNLIFNQIGELSTVDSFSDCDLHAQKREQGNRYQVKTISLEDLLDKYNAPSVIDYLSIDTEGSEFEILSSFNFEKYKFKIITCEHNFTSNREKIYSLLKEKGYVRKHAEISKFDDWFVLKENI